MTVTDRIRRQLTDLYEIVHKSLIRVLGAWNLQAKLAGETADSPFPEPFLCFQRRSPQDVLIGTHKVLGSAQKRRQGAMLQHGSLLVQTSPYAPVVPGMQEISSTPITVDEIATPWQQEILTGLKQPASFQPLSTEEIEEINATAANKFRTAAWNARK